MTRVELRVPLGLGKVLHDTVFAHADGELVAFCLVSHFVSDGAKLVVRRVITLRPEDYTDDPRVGAAWRGTAMLPALLAATDEQLGIVLVHAHPWRDPAKLSRVDLESARRLVPMFQLRAPDRPHGSIVLGPRSASGAIALPGSSMADVDVSIRWMGKSIVRWSAPGALEDANAASDSQALVVGERSLLRRARVAVVGLSGGGSHVVQQLAHAEVGAVVGIDADTAERKHRHRMIGLEDRHVAAADPKTKVMDDLNERVVGDTNFIGIDAMVPGQRTIEALRDADVIVGCVDNLHARADLQEVAWRYCVPYVDVGVSIRALERPRNDPRVSVGGNVLVLVPGGFCMWCCGFVSKDKLDLELAGGRDRSYFQNRKGEAQVVSFNGTVASAAVSEVLQLLTGFRGESFEPRDLEMSEGTQQGFLKFDGRTLLDWGATRRAGCEHCRRHLGAGQIVWARAA